MECSFDKPISQLLNLEKAGLGVPGKTLYEVYAVREPSTIDPRQQEYDRSPPKRGIERGIFGPASPWILGQIYAFGPFFDIFWVRVALEKAVLHSVHDHF